MFTRSVPDHAASAFELLHGGDGRDVKAAVETLDGFTVPPYLKLSDGNLQRAVGIFARFTTRVCCSWSVG